jgi:hypothetical protein
MTARATQLAEISAPSAAIGIIAGALVGGMSMIAGLPAGWAIVATLTMGVPLALFGAGYAVLVTLGHIKVGVFAPAALYWMIGFPVSRLAYETLTPVLLGGGPRPPADILTFLAYQGLVSLGFAIGFIWMFERITPPWLVNIKDHNPAAEQLYTRYAHHAAVMWETRERRRARRADRPAAAAAGKKDRSRRSA